jgi:predicted ATPase
MITALEIENYRGFGKRQRIDLSSVNLFYGANSAGKSTVTNALLFIHEFMVMGNESPERSLLGGRFVNFGSYRELAHKGDQSKPIHIKIELFFDWKITGQDWGRGYTMEGFDPKTTAETVAIEFTFESIDNMPKISSYIFFVGNQKIAEINLLHEVDTGGKLYHTYFYKDLYKTTLKYNGTHPCCPVDSEWKSVIEDDFYASEKVLSRSNFFGYGKNELLLKQDRTKELDRQRDFFAGWMIGISKQLVAELENFIPIGPLREIPQDFHARRGNNINRVANGLSAWDNLATLPPHETEKFNKWLGEEGLDLGYKMFPVIFAPLDGWINEKSETRYSKHSIRWDLISNANGSISSEVMRRIEFYKTDEKNGGEDDNEWRLMPTSLGVGLSQIVPIIYHCLNSVSETRFPSKILTIEQPELHLHPRAQTRLGDLFLACFGDEDNDYVNNETLITQQQVVAETHSEHLILRILRRIRETTNGILPASMKPVTTSRVAVYYFTSSEEGTIAKRLHINDQGEFIDSWPNGFFEERLEELF